MERMPGGPPFSADECIDMRWREVEIHHADLGAGYTAADWPPAFTTYLLGSLAARPHRGPHPPHRRPAS